jgi:hypothetical protein
MDIPSETLLKHQNYMIENNKLGIIQYYSLQGSFFMNEYLRGLTPYKYKNDILEKNILSMWELINKAPEFKKSYILYRFINKDNHLANIKIGQNYITPSFLSTTRDPFYRPEEFKFGFILLKIKIPKNEQGVALCIESISNFPKEQEIILSPLSILKLEKKNENVPYFHTDEIYRSKINTLYEFTYIGKKPIKLIERPVLKDRGLVDFLKSKKENTITMEERISYFVNNYALPVYNFKTKIGDNEYSIITEWYDSIDVYKKFYGARTDNGFSMYTIIDNYIGFTIELGEDTDGTFMYVNYYFKHSSVNKTNPIDDNDFLYFISTIGYYFEIKTVYLYSSYSSCGFKSDIDKIDEKVRELYKESGTGVISKIESLLGEREVFGGRYRFLTGINLSPPISYKDFLKRKRELAKGIVVHLWVDEPSPKKIQGYLGDKLASSGYPLTKGKVWKKSATHLLTGKLRTNQEHLKVEGFEKYAFTLTIDSQNRKREKSGSLNILVTETGRNFEQAYEKALVLIKEKIDDQLYKINFRK